MTGATFLLDVVKGLSTRLEEIERRHGYLSYLSKKRFTNEKLLQLETMHIISQMPDVADYLPEKVYDPQGKEKCDFWFKLTDGTEFWMEIKMRPTNYRKPGHAKAITNGVDGVIEDIQRLRNIKQANARRFVLFAFYPLYADSYKTFNEIHLKRISQEVGKQIEKLETTLKIEAGADFNLYFVEIL
jgi:hypothetical protein